MTTTERRQTDVDVGVLKNDVVALKDFTGSTRTLLEKHVNECAALQKKGFGVLIFLAGWTVAHSPEGLGMLTKALKLIMPDAVP